MAGMLPDDELYEYMRMRNALPRSDMMHGMLGPLEHRQFTQEAVQRNPWMAIPLAAAIPAYTGMKALGLTNARSPASVDEMFAGYEGLMNGLAPTAKRTAGGMLSAVIPPAYAHHEESETVQRPDGMWINVYGRRKPNAGQQLPDSGVYSSLEEAEQAARERSAGYKPGGSLNRVDGTMYPSRAPRRDRHGGGGVRG